MNITLKQSLKNVLSKNSLSFQVLKAFATKKTIKPTSGSDVEADKSKKTLRGQVSDNETSQKPKKTEMEIPRNLKEVQTVEGHKAPVSEDTVEGKYAETLFITASMANNLYNVYNDMAYILDIANTLPEFNTLKNNAGLNYSQINGVCEDIAEMGGFCETTKAFLRLVAENKRFMYVDKMAQKYIKTYQLLSKEEKITIISAHELDNTQRDKVRKALLSNPENEGKTFIIDFTVNPSIVGGLQMYSENKFMDLSLNSRIEKLKEEVNRLI